MSNNDNEKEVDAAVVGMASSSATTSDNEDDNSLTTIETTDDVKEDIAAGKTTAEDPLRSTEAARATTSTTTTTTTTTEEVTTTVETTTTNVLEEGLTTRVCALLVLFMGLISVCSSVTGGYWCHLLKYEAVDEIIGRFGTTRPVPKDRYPTIYTGLYTTMEVEIIDTTTDADGTKTITIESKCMEYDADRFDPYEDSLWHGSVVCKSFVLIITNILICMQVLNLCGCEMKYGFHITGVGFFFASLFELLSLMVVGSDLCKENALLERATYYGQPVYGDCKLGDGFSYVLIAIVGFLGTAIYSTHIAFTTPNVEMRDSLFLAGAGVPLLSSTDADDAGNATTENENENAAGTREEQQQPRKRPTIVVV